MLIVEVVRRFWVPILGVAALIVGVVVVLTPAAAAGSGWSAYAPFSDTTFVPSGVPWRRMLGAALAVAGAITVLVWALRAHRRRGAPPTD